ncbi:MAG: hypothetical protein AAB495_02685 [Patescibacteria group bacterium]
MKKVRLHTKKGFSIIEALLAGALFTLIASAFIGAVVYGEESTQLSGELSRGATIAEEGIEATRNIRDNAFSSLTAGNNGLAISGNQWIFSGVQDVVDIFTRKINVAPNSLGSGSRSVSVSTTWTQTQQRGGSINISSYLTNWRGCRGGILVYGDGGATTDAIKYKTLKGNDASDCTWSSAASAADVDTGTTNKSLRAVQVYASSNRHEKIMLSRHYNGTTQYIYAQVFDGTSGTWGNVQLLSSWAAATFLDVQNFSGTYLANGDFMVVYSDNGTTPKSRTWDGSSWLAQVSMPDMGGNPNYIVVRARPGTNEVMAAFFDQSSDTNTEYFNGGTYATANWTLHTEHASAAPNNTQWLVDFAWSPNNSLKGGLIYSDAGTDKSLDIKIWTADGSGGGSWSAVVNSTNQASNLGPMAIRGRPGMDEFVACDKDAGNPPRVICYNSNFTPTWTNPTNNIIVDGTDAGIQRSFDIGFESVFGDPAVAVYSDRTLTPKLKKYTASTTTWDLSATNLSVIDAALATVRITPYPNTDEMMILLGDVNSRFYSVVWDGDNNVIYTTPGGYAFAVHGVNGSIVETDYWYDFAWDLY